MKLKQLFCEHELGMTGSILFTFSPDGKVIPEDHSHFICKKCGKKYKDITMIDIEKLLNSKHVTVRFFNLFSIYIICEYENFKPTTYWIKFKNGNKYKLPIFIQVILKRIWG